MQEIEISKTKTIENSRLNLEDNENMASLMQSIKQHGLKQPIGVYTNGTYYFVIWGHRRLEACKKLGWNTIPAIIEKQMDGKQQLIINTIENIQREDITPFELGRVCFILKDNKLTNSEIAARLNILKGQVKNVLLLFNRLPEKHKDNVISMYKNTKDKRGKIPVNTMTMILRSNEAKFLSEEKLDEVMEVVRMNELDWYQTDALLRTMKTDSINAEGALLVIKSVKIFGVKRLTLKNEVYDKLRKKYFGKSMEFVLQGLLDKECETL